LPSARHLGHLGDNLIMPYRKVQFAQGQFYHVYNRGVERQPIFWEEENYQELKTISWNNR
jgi:hypothetical protein